MLGKNSLELNEGTMIEIVQHYFNTVLFKEKVKVTGVKPFNTGVVNSFKINMDEEQKEPALTHSAGA